MEACEDFYYESVLLPRLAATFNMPGLIENDEGDGNQNDYGYGDSDRNDFKDENGDESNDPLLSAGLGNEDFSAISADLRSRLSSNLLGLPFVVEIIL